MTQLAEIRNYSIRLLEQEKVGPTWTCGFPTSRQIHLVTLLPFVLQTCFIKKLYIKHCKCLQRAELITEKAYTPQMGIPTALFHRYCRKNLCKYLPCSEHTLNAAAPIKSEACQLLSSVIHLNQKSQYLEPELARISSSGYMKF